MDWVPISSPYAPLRRYFRRQLTLVLYCDVLFLFVWCVSYTSSMTLSGWPPRGTVQGWMMRTIYTFLNPIYTFLCVFFLMSYTAHSEVVVRIVVGFSRTG